MSFLMRFILLLVTFLFYCSAFASDTVNIPILCYHNLNPTVPGSMNLTPKKLESQIVWLKENGFTIIPLQDVVEYLQGTRASLPKKSIVITADDGWQSVYTYLFPLARKYNIPVTLFIYPQTISNGKHAMTWEELKELQQSGFFDIQSHTYSHPNFKQEKRHRSRENYEKFVTRELVNSKQILEEKLQTKITLFSHYCASIITSEILGLSLKDQKQQRISALRSASITPPKLLSAHEYKPATTAQPTIYKT